jgi:N-hydroxyarylamine O-acetyltransferase
LWEIERLDIPVYLQRIGIDGTLPPTVETLQRLHRAHAATIPFENLDILLGRGISLDIDDLQDKLLRHRRGGYCYEHNLLFAALLERLGFDVMRLAARVQSASKPRTHMLLNVRIDGETWLADVGFGAALLEPIPLRNGVPAQQGGWIYRLDHRASGEWILRSLRPEGWADLYAFVDDPQLPIDYAVYNHYVSTHPKSPFTGKVVAIRTTPDVRFTLNDHEFTIGRPDGATERHHLDAGAFVATLRKRFGIDLTAAEATALLAHRESSGNAQQGTS